ncbi:MAG: hypothetical protein J6O39_07315 [Treponema sp.]|nr:hypothetical protein [Treponema sp.]
MKRNIFFISLVFVFVMVFSACSFYENKEQTVLSLKVPEEFSDEEYWIVEYFDRNRRFCTVKVCRNDSFSVAVVRNAACAFSARPSEDGKVKTDCVLGTVYPYGSVLTREGCLASCVYNALVRAGKNNTEELFDFLDRFNWKKLMEECARHPDTVYDLDRIIKAVAAGTFKKGDLKPLEK